ncbi:hypothetical protein NMY22_g3488 [Coprinellus aureogranulatus]|nr:hypothetical protein NMY22_g3488 [Coprinellus aureogranulatus]
MPMQQKEGSPAKKMRATLEMFGFSPVKRGEEYAPVSSGSCEDIKCLEEEACKMCPDGDRKASDPDHSADKFDVLGRDRLSVKERGEWVLYNEGEREDILGRLCLEEMVEMRDDRVIHSSTIGKVILSRVEDRLGPLGLKVGETFDFLSASGGFISGMLPLTVVHPSVTMGKEVDIYIPLSAHRYAWHALPEMGYERKLGGDREGGFFPHLKGVERPSEIRQWLRSLYYSPVPIAFTRVDFKLQRTSDVASAFNATFGGPFAAHMLTSLQSYLSTIVSHCPASPFYIASSHPLTGTQAGTSADPAKRAREERATLATLVQSSSLQVAAASDSVSRIPEYRVDRLSGLAEGVLRLTVPVEFREDYALEGMEFGLLSAGKRQVGVVDHVEANVVVGGLLGVTLRLSTQLQEGFGYLNIRKSVDLRQERLADIEY